MFLLTYFPYGVLSLIHGHNSILQESTITLLSILFVLLANLCSPIIFAYRNKRVRRGVRRLLGIDKKTNERLEKLNSLKRSCSTRIKNYRQNNLHKSLNLGFKSGGNKPNDIRRSQSFVACKYLTPPDATSVTHSPEHHKEKKSILKIVCDSSRKFGCQFSNCGHQETVTTTPPVEVWTCANVNKVVRWSADEKRLLNHKFKFCAKFFNSKRLVHASVHKAKTAKRICLKVSFCFVVFVKTNQLRENVVMWGGVTVLYHLLREFCAIWGHSKKTKLNFWDFFEGFTNAACRKICRI